MFPGQGHGRCGDKDGKGCEERVERPQISRLEARIKKMVYRPTITLEEWVIDFKDFICHLLERIIQMIPQLMRPK